MAQPSAVGHQVSSEGSMVGADTAKVGISVKLFAGTSATSAQPVSPVLEIQKFSCATQMMATYRIVHHISPSAPPSARYREPRWTTLQRMFAPSAMRQGTGMEIHGVRLKIGEHRGQSGVARIERIFVMLCLQLIALGGRQPLAPCQSRHPRLEIHN